MKDSHLFRNIADRIRARYGKIVFHPMDFTVIGYTLLLGFLIIPFHHNVPKWGRYPVIHSLIVILILEFLRFYTKRPTKVMNFARIFYPFIFLSSAWSEFDSIATMIFPFWANDFAINLDKSIFGVHPTVWVEKIFTPWLTEFMNFFYATHFLIVIPAGGLTLYFLKRKQDAMDFLFLLLFTYSVSFIMFLFFPAEGPWVVLKHLHTVKPEGGFFLKLNQFIQRHGSVRGCAFPSSHVTAAFVILLGSFKYQKSLGFILLPFVLGVTAATVYCQYHHAVDALSGILLGVITYGTGIWILKKWHRSKEETP
ncbi:MAG: phosphatase PAP2 family protein [bacterium]